jgi:hypothetical protein
MSTSMNEIATRTEFLLTLRNETLVDLVLAASEL